MNLRVRDLELGALIPIGDVASTREEWLCEAPSYRVQVRVRAAIADAVLPFGTAAVKLGATVEKWGPRNAFRRARGNEWVATVSDASTDISMVNFVVDFRQISGPEITAGAQRSAGVHLAAYSPLWTEHGLPILMVSVETTNGRTSKGYVQLGVGDMASVARWLESERFQNQDGSWMRDTLTVYVSPGKISAALN